MENDNVFLYFNTHKSAFSEWKEGEPVKSWIDENNILCIQYESGNWWHYRMNKKNLEWW